MNFRMAILVAALAIAALAQGTFAMPAAINSTATHQAARDIMRCGENMVGAGTKGSACGGSRAKLMENATPSGTPTNMAPDAQQILRLNVGSEPNTLDPQAQSYTYEATIINNTYVKLFDQDPHTSELVPMAAAEVPTIQNGGISSDGLTYTIHLKPGLEWSDTTPLTAQDFVYGIIRGFNLNISGLGYGGFITQIKGAGQAYALNPSSPTYMDDIRNLFSDSIVAVDSATIQIVIVAPSVSFLSNLVLPITAAVKQSNVEALGAGFGRPDGAGQMVTSGPFTIKEWVQHDHVTLERNDYYTAGHEAYLREVEIFFIAFINDAYSAFQAGQLDEAQLPLTTDASTVKNVKQEQEFGTRWIAVDVTLPPWNNKDFVIGINQATDRATIARDIYQGQRTGWAAPCAPAVLYCDPALFSNLEYNLANAQASITRAYPDGNIPPVTLETVDDPTVGTLAATLQSQWTQVGVTVNIKLTDQATLRADMKNHISGTQITGWGMDYADPTDLWSILTTSQVGANNLGFYSRPQYDQLAAEQDLATDPAQRQQLLTQLQQFYASDPADITFALQLRTDVFNPKVQGLVSSPFDYQVYGDQFLSDAYIAQLTALTAPVSAGATELQVSSAAGIAQNDRIVINPGGANQEANRVVAFGSLMLATPLLHGHEAGQLVVRLRSGDVDCNGVVDTEDAMGALQAVTGIGAGDCGAAGDVDCSGTVTAEDALLLLHYSAGLAAIQLPEGCPPVGA